MSSRDAVNAVQRAARKAGWGKRAKVGHAGTLDPIAAGVLVVCVGKATKFIDRVQALPKTYEAGFRLHVSSPSLDIEHEPTPLPHPPAVTREQIETALPEFLGEIDQTPPAFSAVKIDGQRAYHLARRGEEVAVQPKRVRVDRLTITDFDGDRLGLSITCGSGFYVRSLGRDLAQSLGTEAVMETLLRSAIGDFTLREAIEPKAVTPESLPGLLSLPFKALGLSTLFCNDAAADDLRNGRFAALDGPPGEWGVRDESGLPVCIGVLHFGGTLRPKITFPKPTV